LSFPESEETIRRNSNGRIEVELLVDGLPRLPLRPVRERRLNQVWGRSMRRQVGAILQLTAHVRVAFNRSKKDVIAADQATF
jgi:hypothetical protein